MSNFHFSPRPNRAHEISWHDYSPAAFEEAQGLDKPILLGISAVWCHWCHVMDETSYSDSTVIQLVNERFVPIRVDNDERPDVNRRYNLGGWPTTAFLTPDGELLTGGTYIPPEQMISYLNQVSEVYRNSKDQILQKITEIRGKREQAQAPRARQEGELSGEIVDNVVKDILLNFDSVHGGFGDEPKFPQTDALELALAQYYETGDPALLQTVTLTLEKMASGGLYDQVWGGFFRYSTTRDWRIPHYEKMLEDNAKLLSLYVHAYQVTGHTLFLKTIRSLLAYVELSLSDETRGGFSGSQDADEHFYTLPMEERAKLPAPFVDRTFYTDWNALMISAYLDAASIILPSVEAAAVEGNHVQSFALKSLDRLWNEMYRPGEGLYHFVKPNGTPQLTGLLSDLARTTAAQLGAHQATGDVLYVQRARILADLALETLFDERNGCFWSELPRSDSPGLLRLPERSMNDNAIMANALMRLHRVTQEERYRQAAGQALRSFAGDYAHFGLMAADYASAVDHWLHEPLSVRIIGGVHDTRTQALQAAALKQFAPEKVVELLDPMRDATRLDQLGYPHDTVPLAYVCVGNQCLAPVSDPEGIITGMKDMASTPSANAS